MPCGDNVATGTLRPGKGVEVIDFKCPKCGEGLSAPDSLAGQSETCPECGNVATVPAPPTPTAPLPSSIPQPTPLKALAEAPSKPSGTGKVLWRGSPSWESFLGFYILAILTGLVGLWMAMSAQVRPVVGTALMLLGGLIVMSVEFYRAFTKYRITDQIVYLQKGVLMRTTTEVPVAHLREVKLKQGMFERMLGVGSLGFSTSASSDMEIIWRGVRSPGHVRDLVRKLIW